MRQMNHVVIDGPLVKQACVALREGRFDDAETLAAGMLRDLPGNALWLNLLGVAREGQGYLGEARRCYGRASVADESLQCSQTNLRRLYELHAFGRSNEPVALGDHEQLLRGCLEASLMRRKAKRTAI